MTGFLQRIDQVVGPTLARHGFERSSTGWIRESARAFNAFAAFESDTTHIALFGWRYAALGDPDPDPRDARGCMRRMALDVIAPTNDLQSLLAYPGSDDPPRLDRWVQRLTVAWNRAVVPWLAPWERADGYRDYLSSRLLHLGAAWVSAALGQRQRAMTELDLAHRYGRQHLTDGYDRARAERDIAIAAPFAARHGLAGFLSEARASGKTEVLDAFTRERGRGAQAKITAPEHEHRRLQYQQAAYAELCRRLVAS